MRIRVSRFTPQVDAASREHEYVVPDDRTRTALAALLFVYEEIDSTLAFRYGCSDRDCGLCAVGIDGKPRLACHTPVRDGMLVGPLPGLPIVRDLVIDRSWVLPFLRRFQVFIPPTQRSSPGRIVDSSQHRTLMGCTECLGCLSTCPDYDHADASRGGPYQFVKLAQCHFDPRDAVDRPGQARSLQIERCLSCQKCYCLMGLPIVRDGILPLATAVGC